MIVSCGDSAHNLRMMSGEKRCLWQREDGPEGRDDLSRLADSLAALTEDVVKTSAIEGEDAAGPMQVVSGPIGRQRVHYQAPPASRLDDDMADFLHWLNHSHDDPALLKAGLDHLWFVTLHPFDDGNGRIARAVGGLLLVRADGSPQRFYRLSAQIQRERDAYYDVLERFRPFAGRNLGGLSQRTNAIRSIRAFFAAASTFAVIWYSDAGSALMRSSGTVPCDNRTASARRSCSWLTCSDSPSQLN